MVKKAVFLLTVLTPAALFAGWGDVVASFAAPGSNPGGLTYDGTYLWYADYGSGSSPSTVYKMTTAGSIAGQWVVNWSYATGLAWDGAYLWSDALSKRYVYRMDPSDCSVVSSFYGPSAHMMGMGCDGTYLFINDWQDRRISKVDFNGSLKQIIGISGPSPAGVALEGEYIWYTTRDFWTPDNAKCIRAEKASGSFIASFTSPDSQMSDLAFDGTYLWGSGFTNKYIYQIDISSTPAVMPTSLGRVKALYR